MELKDQIKVTDKMGFIYNVSITHLPGIGISIAYHNGTPIARREYGRMLPPMSDDDREWEEWEMRFREWADGPLVDLEHECKLYFDLALA